MSAASWAIGNGGSARGDGDFLSDLVYISSMNLNLLKVSCPTYVVSGSGGHGGASEDGNGDNGETHFEYYLSFCLKVLKSCDRMFTELFCRVCSVKNGRPKSKEDMYDLED